MPAAAAYAAREAEVSPVEAQPTARICRPLAIIWRTIDTSTVIPRSLNEPVCELPHNFTHTSSIPIPRPKASARNRLVPPSSIDTTLLSSISGHTHSFLPQTLDPYGQVVRLYRSSNNRIHAAALRSRSASRSCATSSNPPHVGHR